MTQALRDALCNASAMQISNMFKHPAKQAQLQHCQPLQKPAELVRYQPSVTSCLCCDMKEHKLPTDSGCRRFCSAVLLLAPLLQVGVPKQANVTACKSRTTNTALK